jgi:sulfate transport system permease protein
LPDLYRAALCGAYPAAGAAGSGERARGGGREPGANRWQTFIRVLWPTLVPALLTGFALAFARGVGEYGSVIFIAGNLPMVSEIAPLMIMSHLEEYDYAGASAIASVMLLISFVLLLLINKLQAWSWVRIGGSRI